MNKSNLLSATRIRRLKAQGYLSQTDAEITELAFGNRFAYRLCTFLLAIGVVSANIPILSLMFVMAFLGFILSNHPFDYVYNHLLAARMNKPKLPKRSKQLKFACAIATLWIGATIYLFIMNLTTVGYAMGSALIGVAFTVATTDFCLPSVIYNALFYQKEAMLN